MMTDALVPGSFRDPSGFLFVEKGTLYRQVNTVYQPHYDTLLRSGLYQSLVETGLLIPHSEVDPLPGLSAHAYKLLKPQVVPFISYPYEWSFSQLKAAALVTLEIQERALGHGMSLKDCSAYNIQFVAGKPVLIDTLSFEIYREGLPWTPYRQFCQHFLAPLALATYKDIRLLQLSRIYIDGVPLDLATALLPGRSYFKLPLLLHLHLHARSQRRYSDKTVDKESAKGKVSRNSLLGLIDNLKSAVKKLEWNPANTAWADYYQEDSYDAAGLEDKKRLVSTFLDEAAPETAWDLGSNTGLFSRIAAAKGIQTISWDFDPGCVDANYREVVKNREGNLLPLVLDLANPSPAIGWENRERMSLLARAPVDAVLALALIHHLAISNNVPLDRIARFLADLGRWSIVEFVPKEDQKVQKLLSTREDIFDRYTRAGFEEEFSRLFVIKQAQPIRNSARVLYLLEKRQ